MTRAAAPAAFLIAFLLAPFLAAAPALAKDPYAKIDRALTRIVAGKGGTQPVASVALVVMVGGETVYAGAAGCAEFPERVGDPCLRPFRHDTKFRVASISKMALAMGLEALVDDGRLDLDADVSRYLGWKFENPNFPGRAITARQLLAHLSSVRDPEEYWLAAPGDFRTLFAGQQTPFAAPVGGPDLGPGGWFEYANLNYGILAGVIEGAAGERFDRYLSRAVFAPMGLDIGYNWSGVSAPARRAGGALAAREGDQWSILVDKPEVLAGELPYFLAADGLDRAAYLAAYRPGDNPTLFSPQGGLRASTEDLARLVRRLTDDETLSTPVWRYHDEPFPNGDRDEGYFAAYGLGVQTIPAGGDLLPMTSLVGHPGEAYGAYSGAWLARAGDGRAKDLAFAFVATGIGEEPAKGTHPTFNAIEEKLVRLALKAETAALTPEGDGPRPYSPTANAMEDVDATLARARASGRNTILVFGTNACHDSRGLARKFQTAPLDDLIASSFELIFVDVGAKDRNLEVARRFGIDKVIGTPTVLVLDPVGKPLNLETAAEWRNADSRPFDETLAAFRAFADRRE